MITSARALNAESTKLRLFDPLGVATSYIWVKGPPAAVTRALQRDVASALLPGPDRHVPARTPTSCSRRGRSRTCGSIAIAAGILVLIGAAALPPGAAALAGDRLCARPPDGPQPARGDPVALRSNWGRSSSSRRSIGAVIAIAAAAPIARHLDPLPDDPPVPGLRDPDDGDPCRRGRARRARGRCGRADELVCRGGPT